MRSRSKKHSFESHFSCPSINAFQKHGAFLWKRILLRLNSINNIKCLFNHDKKLECYAWFISCVWIYLSLQIFNHWKNRYCFDLVMDDDSWTKSIALSVWMEKVQSLPRFKDNASKCHSTKNSLGLFQAREYQRTLEHFGIRNIKKTKQSWSQLWLPNSYLSLFLRNFNEKNSNKKLWMSNKFGNMLLMAILTFGLQKNVSIYLPRKFRLPSSVDIIKLNCKHKRVKKVDFLQIRLLFPYFEANRA